MNSANAPQVVVIGAGFAGLNAAKVLAGSGCQVVLVDRQNHHTFVPLLYQVATAEIEPELIAYPLRSFVQRHKGMRFLMAEVEQIDFEQHLVKTDRATLPYDYLILATGSQTQYLGVEGAQRYGLPMRTLPEAIALRHHILGCFERAAWESDPIKQESLLSFVIVGGGPTGVELAGATIELIRKALSREYPTLNPHQARVFLLQGGDRLLSELPHHLCDYTAKSLRRIGVKVHLGARVAQVTPEAVHLADGTTIPTQTAIWTAGVEAATPSMTQEIPTAAKGKIRVIETLQLPEHPQVYAIGDVAYVEDNGMPLVGVAPEALQHGTAVARNILRQQRGLDPKPFDYFNKGRAAIIARNAGVAHLLGKIPMSGPLAWLLWLGIHLFYLPGWRNKLVVLLHWICDYFFHQRFVGLILSPSPSPKD